MFIPSTRLNSRTRSYTPKQPTVESLKSEVHDLTVQTDQFRDESTAALAVTTTAGLATLAGGALALLPATQTVGMAVAGIAGLFFAGGVAVTMQTNSKLEESEAHRLDVSGQLFDTRKATSREKIRKLFS